ncbi:hypothetical protein C8Q80DRAFT_882073 [Daedaleopsis nitida]|nr:hypothetical protein C8Q80DRAFT_882073 [Daedaleopsis nitida]
MNSIGVTSRIGEKLLYPMVAMNPHLPLDFGRPGLLIAPQQDWDNGRQRVILGLRNRSYWYIGEYEVSQTTAVSKEEYAMWPQPIQQEWANRILKKTHKPITRRIALRLKHGREPTADELEAAAKLGPTQLQLPDVTTEDIINAYTRGEESMCVWRMQCVGFDNLFLQEIAEAHSKTNDKKPVIQATPLDPVPPPPSAPATVQ